MLNKGELDGQRILTPESVATLTANQIGDLHVKKMTSVIPALTADVDVFPGVENTYSLGFLRLEADVPGKRAAGLQGWAGVANTHFLFDPKNDIAAVLFTQSLPFVESPFVKVYEEFERAVYAAT